MTFSLVSREEESEYTIQIFFLSVLPLTLVFIYAASIYNLYSMRWEMITALACIHYLEARRIASRRKRCVNVVSLSTGSCGHAVWNSYFGQDLEHKGIKTCTGP